MTKKTRERFTVSRTEFARLVGCTPDRVSKYIQEGLPVISTGSGRGNVTTLDLSKAIPWLLKRLGGTYDEARTRFYQARAEREERANRVRAGELIEVSAVRLEYFTIATNVKARLRAIPSTAAAPLVSAASSGPAAVQVLLLRLIDDALRELASGREPATKAS